MFIHQWREHDQDQTAEGAVRSLLCAAAAPSEPGPQPGEESALAAFRATVQPPRRFSMHSLIPVKAALAAAVTGGVLLTGGVAAAATGSLPGAAQDTAREMLAHVGVSVPGAAAQSAGHADQRGPASNDASKGGAADQHAGDSTNKGAAVSNLARNTPSGGVSHGATVSTFASGGKSKAGQQGKAGQNGNAGEQSGQSTAGQDHQPATPPKPTQSKASGDHADTGKSSGGTDAQSSAAGSGQRP